ncbi:ABC transporter permease [Mycoplasma zalophidermidis]|uniref:ABC transporter permease n=1 Tax=Mycoplasma zalophidermidis TaxID=398174 RepID=A0ABS6DRD1_9MOLU|nr:ABC transporter permease [Mycoplasma zalophidermidis]MBU4689670.1 ABC transporter permease [Mycoplasma zalophidermidis]MBU4693570.1 ABC transporter permease [Mycoplasma zalophidermidis]MCR8966471.1 ABC transporter permease [Mycoplasma zalophidermidis]
MKIWAINNKEKNPFKKSINHKSDNTFWGIIQIINKHFWKAFVGPFFAFCYPIVFTIILGTIFSYEIIIAATFSIGPLAIACVALPTALFEFKKSTLLKRIGATNIKPINFLLVIACYYFLIMIFSGLWTGLVSLAFFGSRYFNEGKELYSVALGSENIIVRLSSIKDLFTRIHWGGYVYSFIVLTMVSLAVGLFLVSISKSILMIQAIGSTLLILTMFLSGQVLPLAQIAGVKTMWYLSYLTPFKSPIVQNTMAFQGAAHTSQLFYVNNTSHALNNNLYSYSEYETLLKSMSNFTKSLSYNINEQNQAINPNLTLDKFVITMNGFDQNTVTSIEYGKYNIFNANEVYGTVNALNGSYSANTTFESLLKYSIDKQLNILLDTNSTPKQIEEAKGFLTMLVMKAPTSQANLLENLKWVNEINNIAPGSNLAELSTTWVNNALNNEVLKQYSDKFVQISGSYLNDDSIIRIGTKTENILNFVLPYAWSIVLLASAQKSFTWNTR